MPKFNLTPKFINKNLLHAKSLDSLDHSIFQEINSRLDKVISKDPIVTIIIAAWNEELNIIRCIDSLSNQQTSFPFEIIVIDNNSKDKTKETVNKLNVKYLFQKKQGCGPARQLGQENAIGKYILLADADCYYPPKWISIMVEKLSKKNTICVYGNYSFIRNNISDLFIISLYEFCRNIIKSIRHLNRPFLNCLGMSMGYLKEYGLKVGFIDKNIRGDDGRLAYQLMKYGKIRYVGNSDAKIWTGWRTLNLEGGIIKHFQKSFKKEFNRISHYLKKMEDHDPKKTDSKKNYSAEL